MKNKKQKEIPPVAKRPVGRPRICATPEELQLRIDNYFIDGMNLKKVIVGPANNRTVTLIPVPTITGLVLYCGFCDRRSFYEYEEKPEFTLTIKKARVRIESHYEELLQAGLGAGAIFALKNFGWIDEHKVTGPGNTYFFTHIDNNKERPVGDLVRDLNAALSAQFQR
jgi:hypothetical protein